jgi:hypothetical protein
MGREITHQELHEGLREIGWTEDACDSGTVFFYSPQDIVQRCVQTVTEESQAAFALCAERRARGKHNRVVTSNAEALDWAREHERRAGRLI